MSPVSKQHEYEAGEIDDEGKPYKRKRGVDQVYSRHRTSATTSSSSSSAAAAQEDDPFAEYERLSRSKRRDASRERYPYSESRRRYSRDFESNNNNKDKRENSHVSYRGDNYNSRRSRSPTKRTANNSSRKYATTVEDPEAPKR